MLIGPAAFQPPIGHLPWKAVEVKLPFHPPLCNSSVGTWDFSIPEDIFNCLLKHFNCLQRKNEREKAGKLF